MSAQLWEVVGGGDKGGIIVRAGEDTKSEALNRLSTGAVISELELKGNRLHYERLTGTGPQSGWISIDLNGKDLAVKSDKKPLVLDFMSPVEQDADGNNLLYCKFAVLPEMTVGSVKTMVAAKTGCKPGSMIPAKGNMGERIPESAILKEDKTMEEAGYSDGDQFAFIYTGDFETDLKPRPQ
eukprot:gb/GFBE01058270.1/.p1 GENE.gb/GFBE01058270.1/~~gb/GFBE01058270.1/.p1  ORF type:complete len:182 (+),score=36.71 gb/GFBE01058270.1/:1-546(+)